MKKNYRFYQLSVMFVALGLSLVSCMDDEPSLLSNNDLVVDFENAGAYLAGPSSYGENYYDKSSVGDIKQVIEYKLPLGDIFAYSKINHSSYDPADVYNYYGGGVAISNYTYRSNYTPKEGETVADDWWYTPQNQMSVYNLNAKDQANKNGGARGSQLFGVVSGKGSIELRNAEDKPVEKKAKEISLCNTSYGYGVMKFGNKFSSKFDADTCSFEVKIYGFSATGEPTNGGQPVKFKIAKGKVDAGGILSSWKRCDISPLGKVAKITFGFDGTDKGQFGLNTPAYVAIDDIVFEK